jgi:hypothetical protein
MHTETALARTFLVLACAVVSGLAHSRYVAPALILGRVVGYARVSGLTNW